MIDHTALTHLKPPCEVAFCDLVKLYEQSFPESERKPVAALRSMLATEGYHFLVAKEHGCLTGFMIVRALGDSAALLEYLAVAPAQRGRGLGSRILLAAAEAITPPPLTLLVEVESDRKDAPDRAERTRRKRFYRSLGARELVNLGWIMPPVAAEPPPAMEMLAFATDATFIPKDQLRQWLTNIYVHVYGQSPDDPRLEAMLSDLPDEVTLL
jgi:GNAT superfamily N-acetyltransferase